MEPIQNVSLETSAKLAFLLGFDKDYILSYLHLFAEVDNSVLGYENTSL